MSATVDANILVYASNRSDPVHTRALQLIQTLAAGPDLLYLFWPAVLGYLRIVTHPAILPRPLSPLDAAVNVDSVLSRSHVRSPGEEEGFWQLFRQTGRDRERGNAIPDTHLVALMRQHGVRRVYSRDNGLRRFPDIEVIDPFAVRPPKSGRSGRSR
jgi:uncharacterized protein